MIVNIEVTRNVVQQLRESGSKIGMCQGVFDLLHAGHIEHFMMCKSYCDYLFVSVQPDKFANKGPGRPMYGQRARAEIIDCLKMVDYVVCDDWDDETACFAVDLIKPNFYFKGTEYRDKVDLTHNLDKEVDLVHSHGGDIKFLSGKVSSSSQLIKNLEGTPEFYNHAKSASYYSALLDKIQVLRVGVIGEGILDEYITSVSLGSANKYPILSVEEVGNRVDPGGAFAVHNLLKGLCDQTYLLAQNGDCNFYHGDIIKTRYMDRDKLNKLFEINKKFEVEIHAEVLQEFLEQNTLDMLLITDFGHGVFTDEIIKVIGGVSVPKYLMVQHNSANRYVNFPWKYSIVDKKSFCMNSKEAVVNSCQVDIKESARYLYNRMGTELLFITEGRDGSTCYDGDSFVRVPAVASTIRDTIGCGDVFFAISALVIEAEGAPQDALVMANIFAYLHAQIDGNSSVVSKNDFTRFARGLK